MSDLWTPELHGDVRRVDAWARPAQTTHFTPWSNTDHPARRSSDRADFVRRPAAPAEPEKATVDIEAIRAEAFAQGFEHGRETVAMEYAGERRALAELIRSAEALRPESHGPLATILAETVTRLVKQVVGDVIIDKKMLQTRATAMAELVTAEAGPARLKMHPDDAARLSDCDLGVAVVGDTQLAPGTIILETAEGWIEDGPQIRLARLRAQLDAMGMPR